MPEGMWRNLGQALSLVRQIRRRSQTSVANEAGLGKSQLSKYETGRELPKLESLEKVLNALDVGPYEFFYTLHIVDGRAGDLTGGKAGAREAASSATGLPPLSALNPGGSLLSPGAEQSFATLLFELLKLYRAWLEQTLRQPPELPARKARRRGL
jgi:transcriptional regulator with XRE-family HTH domain